VFVTRDRAQGQPRLRKLPCYKISGILAVWSESDQRNIKGRVRGSCSEKRRVRGPENCRDRGSCSENLPRARNIAEGLGEPGEHLEYPVVSRPQFPVGVFANVV
jgi:hypothetical protein